MPGIPPRLDPCLICRRLDTPESDMPDTTVYSTFTGFSYLVIKKVLRLPLGLGLPCRGIRTWNYQGGTFTSTSLMCQLQVLGPSAPLLARFPGRRASSVRLLAQGNHDTAPTGFEHSTFGFEVECAIHLAIPPPMLNIRSKKPGPVRVNVGP